jgi:hypothetical protein
MQYAKKPVGEGDARPEVAALARGLVDEALLAALRESFERV